MDRSSAPLRLAALAMGALVLRPQLSGIGLERALEAIIPIPSRAARKHLLPRASLRVKPGSAEPDYHQVKFGSGAGPV